jgi:hypothetical protein
MAMYHPLVGKLDDLSLDDLLSKINDLHKKLGQSSRFGNFQMVNQIRAALSMYQEEYQKRMTAEAEKTKNHKLLKDKVNIKNDRS